MFAVPRFTTKNSLGDTRAYLEHLGSPDKGMKIIHVAGTNGKGSVCAYLRSVLEEAGKQVAVFTSPHLVDVRERFYIQGKYVSKEAFLEAFLQIYEDLDWSALAVGKGYHPTFFEYLFFMAMLLFSKTDIDYCILETGLGGRLDATNSVHKKELAVITRISLEHVEYLGDTISLIAGEKAGIMQAEVPLVFADVEPEATEVFKRRGEELGSMLYPVSKNDYLFSKIHDKNIDFSMATRYYGYIDITLATIARYQMENASLAIRSLEVLDGGRTITKKQLVTGIRKCIWQGRMEEVLPEVYVDGAHNEDGIRAFLESVREDGVQGTRALLFGVVQDKDYVHMVDEIVASGLFAKVAIARMKTGRALDLQILQELFAKRQIAVSVYQDAREAFAQLVASQKSGERIYVAGSLYLVGEMKEICYLKETLSDD